MTRILFALLILILTRNVNSQEYTIIHDGLTRTYRLHLPEGYSPDSLYPLVFNLHGLTSNAWEQEIYSGFNAVADQEGFLVVYPNGIDGSWNISSQAGTDDVGFISALIDSLDARYGINTDMVYASGMSMGGFMSYRLACELSDRLAAIASVTGLHAFFPCTPARPIPVLQIHGTADPIVPYAGVNATISFWTEQNGCPEEPVITDFPDINQSDNSTVKSSYYGPCNNSSEVILYTVINGEHTWPGSNLIIGVTNQDISASQEIWNFFRKFNRQGSTGIEPPEDLAGTVSLYPNPVKDYFRIDIKPDHHDSFDLRLFDHSGKKVMERHAISGNTMKIDCGRLERGLYFAEISSDTWRVTRKIMIY